MKGIVVGLVGLLLVTFRVWAGTSTIEGIVKDSTGRPIKRADVRIEATRVSKIVKTDATGHYIFDGLGVGTYKVTLIVNGSVRASIVNAKTQLGKSTQLNFDLTAKMAPANRHTHSVWVSTPTGTLIGGTGQWVDVYDDTGLPVDSTGTSRNTGVSSVEKLPGSAVLIKPHQNTQP
jgi:Carboxypeptidase regulatory-like domain